jgi:hypothetical protein
MDNRFFVNIAIIVICATVIVILAVLGFWAYNNLEIYSRKTYFPPSAEARANSYFALEQWLNETGHPVRIEKRGSPSKIAAAPERVALVLASACEWEGAAELLRPWIEQGGFLVISLDYDFIEAGPPADAVDENLSEFLSGFGIRAELGYYLDYSPGQEVIEVIPDFSWDICFYFDDADIFAIRDSLDYARLAEVSLGHGALTVIGRPRFMYNYSLRKDMNAGLSWDLTGGRAATGNTGILFIRDRYISKSLFGKIMDRGNIIPVIVCAFLVIIVGFWMVVPVFGLVLSEKEKTARPIRERFLAEIRFLKKYGALSHYLEVYEREQQPGENREGSEALNTNQQIIRRLRKLELIPEQSQWNSKT